MQDLSELNTSTAQLGKAKGLHSLVRIDRFLRAESKIGLKKEISIIGRTLSIDGHLGGFFRPQRCRLPKSVDFDAVVKPRILRFASHKRIASLAAGIAEQEVPKLYSDLRFLS